MEILPAVEVGYTVVVAVIAVVQIPAVAVLVDQSHHSVVAVVDLVACYQGIESSELVFQYDTF